MRHPAITFTVLKDERLADTARGQVLSSRPRRHGDHPADPLSRRADGRPNARARDEPLTQDDSRRRGRRARHARGEPLDGGLCGGGPDAAALARAGRGRPHRSSRAQPNGVVGVLHRAAKDTADCLVPQRSRAASLAIPALLPPVPRLRPASRRAGRGGISTDGGRSRTERSSREVCRHPIRIGRRSIPTDGGNRRES